MNQQLRQVFGVGWHGTGKAVAPLISAQPVAQSILAGQTATFSVTSNGTQPLSYQWNKNGTAISGATSSSYTTPTETTSDNGAQFSVIISNSAGSVTSNNAALSVTASSVAPSIATQPANQIIFAGQTATFSMVASGTSPLSYQWRKNGLSISGATSASYTTTAETTSDNGALFSVLVSNSAGSVTSSSATLTVNPDPAAPTITSQPASQTITAGGTATFSVTATGTAPLSYQWQKNGAAINGATSSIYTTPTETTSDNGARFTVLISNSVGSATSSAATLTVTTPGQLSAGASTVSFGNVNVGSSSMQSVTLTNTGGSNVSISNETISGAGFSVNGISIGLILSSGGSVTMNVTFAPAASGSVTGSVIIASNASNSPLTISLSGAGVVATHSAALTWTASTSVVVGCNVYRGSTSGGPYTKLNSSLDASTTFTDSSVLSGQTYYYVVTAVDSNNVESTYSNQVTAVIP
jgi:invasion protein IalB